MFLICTGRASDEISKVRTVLIKAIRIVWPCSISIDNRSKIYCFTKKRDSFCCPVLLGILLCFLHHFGKTKNKNSHAVLFIHEDMLRQIKLNFLTGYLFGESAKFFEFCNYTDGGLSLFFARRKSLLRANRRLQFFPAKVKYSKSSNPRGYTCSAIFCVN